MRSWCLHIIFISCHPARYTYLLFGSCCSLIAALTLLSANWYSLLDFYFSLVNARCDSYFTLFATSLSPLAAYRLLLFVAARCWFLASCWSLLATRCSLPHICEVGKKKRVGQLVNSKFLKIRKQKSRPNVGNEKKRCPLIKKVSLFMKKKSAVCRQISKNQRKWFVRKQVGQKSAITTWATSAYVYSLHF